LVVTRVIEVVKIGYNRQRRNGSKSKTQATISMKVTLMSMFTDLNIFLVFAR